jgi:hypothetical protein
LDHRGAVSTGKVQRLGKREHGPALRAPSDPALDVTQRSIADSGQLGQPFQGEVGPETEAANHGTDRFRHRGAPPLPTVDR